jgi:dipeptidyl aminopeptidase/acylaminoacyl peptidase
MPILGRACLALLLAAVARFSFAPAAFAADAIAYRTPPAAVADLLTAPRVPRGAPDLSPDGTRMLSPDLRSLIPIATLAEPVEKLAGLEILPGLRANRAAVKAASSGFNVISVADGRVVRAALPADARVGSLAWSNRGDRVACAVFAPGGAELWIVDAATGAARRLDRVRLHGLPGTVMEWTNDDRALLCTLIADDDLPEEPSRVPAGPNVRVTSGRAAAQRTSRDVLKTADDQQRFAAFLTSRLALVPVDGGEAKPLGEAGAFVSVSLSPDDRYALAERLVLPAPFGFPFYLFPRVSELVPLDGGAVVKLGETPLNDRSALASVAALGYREWTWALDGASLYACSWQDTPGASASAAVRDTALPPPGADRIVCFEAPFTGAPAEIARAEWPVDGMSFTEDGTKLMVWEGYEPRRVERQWWFDPRVAAKRVTLVLRSGEGSYDNPGRPLTRELKHQQLVRLTPDGKAIWRRGEGYRAGGQQPFLDRCPLAGGPASRVFESAPDVLEDPVALLAADASRIVTLRQRSTEPPNYFVRAGRAKPRAITAYTNPSEALSKALRLQMEFARPDGVKLHAEAVLPPDWKVGTRLPTVFWIYPNDYRSAAAASESRLSPNRFPSQSALNPEVLVTQGYAVVRPDLAIVGTNDRYVEELQLSAQAAVDACVERGFADRERIAVGGHSYGAFSTVNCLAHTKLFRAGLASDGAYNRTLTPFTFQAETRNLWEAKNTYLQMSPFLYAQQIDAPLLLAHNQDDTNVGTAPMQSDRLFEALNGLGKTAQLVQYPYEDHGPAARETVLDYWARALEWFDRYVKNAPPRTAAAPAVQP